MPNETNQTTIEVNKYITLVIKVPSEIDIATYDGVTEMVRRINRAVGTIIPGTSRTGRGTGKQMTPEERKEFIEFYKKNGAQKTMEKYNLPDTKRVQQKVWYLKNKFGLK